MATEFGWLIENGKKPGEGLAYRFINNDIGGIPDWTEDPNKALRFARRADAEQFAHHDEDAWCVVEHGWDDFPVARAKEAEVVAKRNGAQRVISYEKQMLLAAECDAYSDRVVVCHGKAATIAANADTEIRRLREVLEAINGALNMGFAAAEVLDENSPIRDAMRAALTPNAQGQATDAALSRQVACTDGLGVAVPPAPTFQNGESE